MVLMNRSIRRHALALQYWFTRYSSLPCIISAKKGPVLAFATKPADLAAFFVNSFVMHGNRLDGLPLSKLVSYLGIRGLQ